MAQLSGPVGLEMDQSSKEPTVRLVQWGPFKAESASPRLRNGRSLCHAREETTTP